MDLPTPFKLHLNSTNLVLYYIALDLYYDKK